MVIAVSGGRGDPFLFCEISFAKVCPFARRRTRASLVTFFTSGLGSGLRHIWESLEAVDDIAVGSTPNVHCRTGSKAHRRQRRSPGEARTTPGAPSVIITLNVVCCDSAVLIGRRGSDRKVGDTRERYRARHGERGEWRRPGGSSWSFPSGCVARENPRGRPARRRRSGRLELPYATPDLKQRVIRPSFD